MQAQATAVAGENNMASRPHGKLCRAPHAHEGSAPGAHSPAAHGRGWWVAASMTPPPGAGEQGQAGD